MTSIDGKIFIGVDYAVTFSGLRDNAGTYLNSATLTYALTNDDRSQTITTGTLTYTSGNGNYSGIIDGLTTVGMVEGDFYLLSVTIVQGSLNDFRQLRLQATYRKTQ